MRHTQKGFTLLELIISAVIVVFLGLTGFKALKTAMAIREDVTSRHVILREFELSTAILRRDFNNIQRFLLPKEVSLTKNKVQRVISVNPSPSVLLSFYLTTNLTLGQPMHKVELVLENDALIRREFDADGKQSIDTILMDSVKQVRASAVYPDVKSNALITQAVMPSTITISFTHPRYGALSLKHGFL